MTTAEARVVEYNGISQSLTEQADFIGKLVEPNNLPSLAEIDSVGAMAMSFFRMQRMWAGGEPVYECITREYIDALSEYIAERVRVYSEDKSTVVIVETGAGSGKLSHFLGQRLGELVPGQFELIATDSGKQALAQYFPVEALDYREALEKYKPAIVITSWMPLGQDWTPKYRETPSVREYILTGEEYFASFGTDSTCDEEICAKDGFVKQKLEKVTRGQAKFSGHHSSTSTFKRVR